MVLGWRLLNCQLNFHPSIENIVFRHLSWKHPNCISTEHPILWNQVPTFNPLMKKGAKRREQKVILDDRKSYRINAWLQNDMIYFSRLIPSILCVKSYYQVYLVHKSSKPKILMRNCTINILIFNSGLRKRFITT